ncbi:SAM-dependent methyltransferase [Allosalinactinospora lopnorensis]|uniref:SAM-dependent methyltransferase n=1 Tax=Allosalinactinospora lopnorensis TaxID=1352348 RepID=UPI000623EA44
MSDDVSPTPPPDGSTAKTDGSGGPQFDVGVPTAARVYDVMLNGKDNYAIDREVPRRASA